MTGLENELVLIGDHLQAAWRADALHARRRRALLAVVVAALLAITGAAIAADVFPIDLTQTDTTPPTAALRDLRATYQPVDKPLRPWQKALELDFTKAVTIAKVTSRETGPLSIVIVPAGRHGVCVDAARPDGSSYVGGCVTHPVPGGDAYNLNVGVMGMTTNGVYHPPLSLSIHTAPLHAARIDVRARDASPLPALISHGWLLFLNPRRDGAAVLVRVYDRSGKRILSYYG